MNNAGMTVKMKYYYSGENYCQYVSNGNGTYSFQSGDGSVAGYGDYANALVVDNNKDKKICRVLFAESGKSITFAIGFVEGEFA